RRLRQEVFTLTENAAAAFHDNCKLRNRLEDASSSVPANIAEGFGRLRHREFHRFLDVSRSSINEVEDRLGECVDKRYLSGSEVENAMNLCKRTRVATSRM